MQYQPRKIIRLLSKRTISLVIMKSTPHTILPKLIKKNLSFFSSKRKMKIQYLLTMWQSLSYQETRLINATSRHLIKCALWISYQLIIWNSKLNVIACLVMFPGRFSSQDSRKLNKNNKYRICLIFLNRTITWLQWSPVTIQKSKISIQKFRLFPKINISGGQPITSYIFSLPNRSKDISTLRLILQLNLVLIWGSTMFHRLFLRGNKLRILH